MMKQTKSRMRKSRDLGIPGPPGKGDADRTTDLVAFNANFAAINFTGPPTEGFVKIGNKTIKTYGKN